MNVKKYTAASTRDALRMVRDELGEEAVILSNRKTGDGVEIMAMSNDALSDMTRPHMAQLDVATPKRAPIPQLDASVSFSKRTVQAQPPVFGAKKQQRVIKQDDKIATAAIPNMAAVATEFVDTVKPLSLAITTPEQQVLVKELKSMRSMLQEQFACMAWSDMQQRDPKRTSLLRNLVNAGFSPALARQLLEKMPANADMSWVNQVLTHNLRVATQAEDVVVRGGVFALTGPTGVGKTTTTAKLAARAVVRYGADSVALITTDGYRVGAMEQLRIYGKILGVAVHAARDTGDLRVTLSGLKHKRLVLIDTMGMGQRDKRLAEQSAMFDAAGVQRLLLLNSTSSGDTLEDVVRMYKGQGVIGCIATKLDEAVTLGAVLDVIMRHKLPLHYVANGQRVPEDLHQVNMTYLLHRAFEAANKAEAFTAQELDIPALMAGQTFNSTARGQHAI
ncbi:MAG: flagellar biosynthesis protein FlhF [Gallionellaceae bacterium]|jgi:flagellar biosynthesis protein FlhF